MTKRLLLAAVAALAVLPVAAAHVHVAVVVPTGPLPVGQATEIPVTISNAACPVGVAEYAPTWQLTLGIVNPEPPAFLQTLGETVPFGPEQCTTSGTLESSGVVTLTPTPNAPAFQDIPLQAGAVGEANDGGEFTIQVAYFATTQVVVPESVEAGAPFELVVELTANADTVLLFAPMDGEHAEHADLGGLPAEFDVPSPLVNGSANRTVRIQATPMPMAEHGNHASQLHFTLTPVAKADRTATGPTQHVTVALTAPANMSHSGDHDEDSHHDETGQEAPSLGLAAILVAIALALVVRRW